MELDLAKLQRIEELAIAARALEEHWQKEHEAARNEYLRRFTILDRDLVKKTGRGVDEHLRAIRDGIDYAGTTYAWLPDLIQQVEALRKEAEHLGGLKAAATQKRAAASACLPALREFSRQFAKPPVRHRIDSITVNADSPGADFQWAGGAAAPRTVQHRS